MGEQGKVIGVDMTEEQIATALKYQAYHAEVFKHAQPNTTFLKGLIEDLSSLSIQDNSVDVVISNCVVNLSGHKEQVFSEIWRVLKPGGELYFSDMFADRRIPHHLT